MIDLQWCYTVTKQVIKQKKDISSTMKKPFCDDIAILYISITLLGK